MAIQKFSVLARITILENDLTDKHRGIGPEKRLFLDLMRAIRAFGYEPYGVEGVKEPDHLIEEMNEFRTAMLDAMDEVEKWKSASLQMADDWSQESEAQKKRIVELEEELAELRKTLLGI